MLSKAVLVLSTTGALVFAPVADAQIVYSPGQIPTRFTVGADVVVAQPKGELASNVPTGYGFAFNGMFRLDRKGWINLRADLGGVQYGHERQRVSSLVSGRVNLNVETDNRIAFGSFGAQVQVPDGWFRPYANAAIASTYFWTASTLSGADSYAYASDTNYDDWSHAWVFGGGVMIPFGKSLGALNLGARYHYGARANYLKEGDITDNPDGSITLNPRSSKTDLVLWQLGFSIKIPRPVRR